MRPSRSHGIKEITKIEEKIRDVPDFPKPGILFKDISPLLNDGAAFCWVIDTFARRYADRGITKIVGIESRGLIFGSALAYAMKVGFSAVRKAGKLPYKTVKESYTLEYGSDSLEMHIDAVTAQDRVVIIDDLLATGGTAGAAARLVGHFGATIVELAFVIELAFLKGASHLRHPYIALVRF